jgi:hypothetical protein
MEKPIRSFTKFSVQQFRAALDEELAKIGEDFGVRFIVGHIRFSDKSFTSKIEVYIDDVVSTLKSDGQLQFEKYCGKHGFSKDTYGKVFNFQGRSMKVIGMIPGSKKYHVTCEDTVTGKRYRFPASTVREALK